MVYIEALGSHKIIFLIVRKYDVMQIAQVHRATLKDGQKVVAKIQHEGIKEVILEVTNLIILT